MAVKLEFRDEFPILTLDRQEALNALSFAIIEEISGAIDEVEGSNVRAFIVTGAGEKAFCAGAASVGRWEGTNQLHRQHIGRSFVEK